MMSNIVLKEINLINFCKRFESLHVYGTGNAAVALSSFLKKKGIVFCDYVVSPGHKNREKFGGKPVIELDKLCLDETGGILISVGTMHINSVLETLKEYKISNDRVYVQDIWYQYLADTKKAAEVSLTKGYFSDYKQLEEIGKKYGTDKCSDDHNFLNKYEFFVKGWKEKEFTLLELGVFRGASIKTWGEYFKKARVVGVDIDKECEKYQEGNCEVIIGDLGEAKTMDYLKELKPEIIVDDASHIWSHQINALCTLFPVLPNGGVYILEDIITSFPSLSYQGFDDTVISAYDFCSAIAETVTGNEHLRLDKNIYEVSMVKKEVEAIAKDVEMISFIWGSCIIVKR